MKKLIAISVVFALVAGSVFAADVSGAVIGTVNVIEGAKGSSDVSSGGGVNRVRIEASGGDDEGKWGGWVRADGFGGFGTEGYAWWQPIDQLKITIGKFSDGFWGKDGVTRWGFYQTASDTGVVNVGNAWGGTYLGDFNPFFYGKDDGEWDLQYGEWVDSFSFSNAFFGGYGSTGLFLTVSPVEMVDINLGIPFIANGGLTKDVLKLIVAQVDLKLGFGNIALTYTGGKNKLALAEDKKGNVHPEIGGDVENLFYIHPDEAFASSPGTLYAYFGLTAIDNLGIDVGIGFPFPVKETFIDGSLATLSATHVSPLSIGLGVKFSAGSFGIKARAVASFAGSYKGSYTPFLGLGTSYSLTYKEPFKMLFDVLPSFSVSDSLRIFFSAGIGFVGQAKWVGGGATIKNEYSVVAWHVNPYVEVGTEWGPKFLAGVRLSGTSQKLSSVSTSSVKWAIPIALSVGF